MMQMFIKSKVKNFLIRSISELSIAINEKGEIISPLNNANCAIMVISIF